MKGEVCSGWGCSDYEIYGYNLLGEPLCKYHFYQGMVKPGDEESEKKEEFVTEGELRKQRKMVNVENQMEMFSGVSGDNPTSPDVQ